MAYSNFSAKIDWNAECLDTKCEYTGQTTVCYPVEFIYYWGKEKHTQEYLLSGSVCHNLESGFQTAREVLEEIKEYEVLG